MTPFLSFCRCRSPSTGSALGGGVGFFLGALPCDVFDAANRTTAFTASDVKIVGL